MNKKVKGCLVLLLTLAITAGFCFLGYVGAPDIKLGLDLNGGVSITYQTVDPDPTAEQMSDTVYKLQQRVQSYSTEAQVYQQGSDRISVEIPGFYDAEEALSSLGAPGSLMFAEIGSTTEEDSEEEISTFNIVCTGDQVTDAQVYSGQDSFGKTEYSVKINFNAEGTEAFKEATERNIGNPIYIIYDGNIISSPTVRTAITGGEAFIEGDFTFQEASVLATSIRL